MEIAKALHVSVETAKTHVRHIFMPLDASIAAVYQRVVQPHGRTL
ncbi:hypothetical protein [Ralstonia sp. A12]|nr:hypothetical protein [Ralstonia sp. A12]